MIKAKKPNSSDESSDEGEGSSSSGDEESSVTKDKIKVVKSGKKMASKGKKVNASMSVDQNELMNKMMHESSVELSLI